MEHTISTEACPDVGKNDSSPREKAEDDVDVPLGSHHQEKGDINCNTTENVKCEMCDCEYVKYTCPGCMRKTCSLVCVKSHKTKWNCTGERNRTAFVEMNEYSDTHLQDDFKFLEDAERKVSSYSRVPEKRLRQMLFGPHHLNKRSKLLMGAALERGMRVRVLPPTLTKHRTNSSFFHVAANSINWHIEWHFAQYNTTIMDQKVPESSVLMDAAGKFTNFVEFPEYRKPLAAYRRDEMDRCRFLLRIDGLPANIVRFWELKPKSTLTENLRGHCVTEYPCIFVLPPGSSQEGYEILSSDDLSDMTPENSRHMTKHHPHFRQVQMEQQSQLLNPHSSLYVAQSRESAAKKSQLLNPNSSLYTAHPQNPSAKKSTKMNHSKETSSASQRKETKSDDSDDDVEIVEEKAPPVVDVPDSEEEEVNSAKEMENAESRLASFLRTVINKKAS